MFLKVYVKVKFRCVIARLDKIGLKIPNPYINPFSSLIYVYVYTSESMSMFTYRTHCVWELEKECYLHNNCQHAWSATYPLSHNLQCSIAFRSHSDVVNQLRHRLGQYNGRNSRTICQIIMMMVVIIITKNNNDNNNNNNNNNNNIIIIIIM